MKNWQRVNELRELLEDVIVHMGRIKHNLHMMEEFDTEDVICVLVRESLTEIELFDKQLSECFRQDLIVPEVDDVKETDKENSSSGN